MAMLEVSHIEKSFGKTEVLKDISFTLEQGQALAIIGGRAEVEVSGNVTRENIAQLTDLGVDYISSGALTHSSPILDLSLKNLHPVE